MNETPLEQHYLREIARLERFNKELWSECQARGEILDEIQNEAGGAWWYSALYALREQRMALLKYDDLRESHADLRARMLAAQDALNQRSAEIKHLQDALVELRGKPAGDDQEKLVQAIHYTLLDLYRMTRTSQLQWTIDRLEDALGYVPTDGGAAG
jgi:hypothetical protein